MVYWAKKIRSCQARQEGVGADCGKPPADCHLPESVEDVHNICEQVAHDIRHQYTLAYYPTNTRRDGTFRAVQIVFIPIAWQTLAFYCNSLHIGCLVCMQD